MKKIISFWGVGLILFLSTQLNAQSFIEEVLKEPIKKAISESAEVPRNAW